MDMEFSSYGIQQLQQQQQQQQGRQSFNPNSQIGLNNLGRNDNSSYLSSAMPIKRARTDEDDYDI